MNSELLKNLVDVMVKESASDLHLAEGRVPVIRVSGFLIPLSKFAPTTKEELDNILGLIMPEPAKKDFATSLEANFAWSSSESRRFRCNAYTALGKKNLAMRLIPT